MQIHPPTSVNRRSWLLLEGDLCKTNTLTLIRTLDGYLAEYEAICSKKDVSNSNMDCSAQGLMIAI